MSISYSQIAAAVARIEAIPRSRTWLGPFNAEVTDLMKAAKTEAERHDVEVAAAALFARRNRTREYGEGQLHNILAEARRQAGPLPLNGLTSRGSAKPRTNGDDPEVPEPPAKQLLPENMQWIATEPGAPFVARVLDHTHTPDGVDIIEKAPGPEVAPPKLNGNANPEIKRALNAARDALHEADNDNAKLLAVRDGAEALENIRANGSAFDHLRDIGISHGIERTDVETIIDQGIVNARGTRTFGGPDWSEGVVEANSESKMKPPHSNGSAEYQADDHGTNVKPKQPEPKSKPRDVNDILQQHGEDAVRDALDQALSEDPNPAPSSVRHNESGKGEKALPENRAAKRNAAAVAAALAGLKTATALQTMTFPQLKYIVPDLIVEGCVLLAGKPKVRKSWLAYDVGLTVASGRYCLGDKKCVEGDVLYLALEDGDRRLQQRATKLLPTFSGKWPDKFHYATKWPRANEGGIDAIDQWCEAHPDARLVVIDVLARFRAPSTSKNAYEQDYAAVSQLQELAVRRSITILVVHHTRKGASEDPVEEISGTLGLGGGADAFLILKRTGSNGTLIGRGRDTEDVDLAMQFSNETCRWTILGQAGDVERTQQRGRVLIALEEAAATGLSPKEIAAEVDGLTHDNAKQLLRRMLKAGEIQKGSYGRYFHASVTLPATPVTPVTLSPGKKKRSKSTAYDGEKSDSDRVTVVTNVTAGDDLTSSQSGGDAVQASAGQPGVDGQ
jgi:hypothetical protein